VTQENPCPDFWVDAARGADCDDTRSTVHPHACDEAGNGLDQDCDGADGTLPKGRTHSDRDGDGYTTDPGVCPDCDDENPDVFPGASEQPQDGVDQNCDGIDDPPQTIGVDRLRSGQLIITELFIDQTRPDGRNSWFEVNNASSDTLNLEGLELRVGAGPPRRLDAETLVAPMGLVVLAPEANSDAPAGSITFPGPGLTPRGAVELTVGEQLIDRVDWGAITDFPSSAGTSSTLYPWKTSSQDNDLGSSWCLGRSRGHFEGLGTPGVENDLCIPEGAPGHRDALSLPDIPVPPGSRR